MNCRLRALHDIELALLSLTLLFFCLLIENEFVFFQEKWTDPIFNVSLNEENLFDWNVKLFKVRIKGKTSQAPSFHLLHSFLLFCVSVFPFPSSLFKCVPAPFRGGLSFGCHVCSPKCLSLFFLSILTILYLTRNDIPISRRTKGDSEQLFF